MKTIKIRDAHGKFRDFLKEKGRSSSTVLAYGKDIEQLISFLEELPRNEISEVTKEDIVAFLGKLQGKGYTPKSLSRKLNSTRTFYRFLKVNEYVTDDPSLLVEHPKYQLAAPRILNPTEYRALRDAATHDARMYAIIEILLQTGIRIGELATLTLDDLKENSIHVKAIEKHEVRDVPLNKRGKEALDKYLKVRPNVESKFLFVTKTGRPFLIRNIRTAIERYFRLAEIKNAKVNDLRHTFVAHHLKHGVSLVMLSKVLGHKRISTTERYLSYVPERGKENGILTEL